MSKSIAAGSHGVQRVRISAEAVMAAKGPVSNTQIEILCLVNRGLSNQEIADKLSITVDTTKWHLHQIFRKLEVHNRTAAAALPGAARRAVEGLRQLRRA